MKAGTWFTLACSLAGIGMVIAADVTPGQPPAPPPPPHFFAPKSPVPLTMDGVLNEDIWQKATPVRVDYVDKGGGVPTEPPKMISKVVWDDHYLYIGYEVFDTNVTAAGQGDLQGPKGRQRESVVIDSTGKADFTEFFISFGDANFFWEIHHNAANNFSDVWCTVVDPKWPLAKSSMHRYGIMFGAIDIIEDEGPYTLATAVNFRFAPKGNRSTLNNPADVDQGYTAEIRLPWAGIGAPRDLETFIPVDPNNKGFTIPGPWKMTGQTASLLSVCHNGDINQNYFHSAPQRQGGWFHTSYPLWPVYEFVDTMPEPKP